MYLQPQQTRLQQTDHLEWEPAYATVSIATHESHCNPADSLTNVLCTPCMPEHTILIHVIKLWLQLRGLDQLLLLEGPAGDAPEKLVLQLSSTQ